jgi:hypothetical protein
VYSLSGSPFKMSRVCTFPVGALRLSQLALDAGCTGVMIVRGGRPYIIGANPALAFTGTPTYPITDEGIVAQFTSGVSVNSGPITRVLGSTQLSVIARFKCTSLPAGTNLIAGAARWTNSVNSRGPGVGIDSSGKVIGYMIGGTGLVGNAPTTPGSVNTFLNTWVTVGATAAASGSCKVYENGTSIGSINTGSGAAGSGATGRLLLADTSASMDPFIGQVAWAAGFNGLLSDTAHAFFAAHPEKLVELKYPNPVIAGFVGSSGITGQADNTLDDITLSATAKLLIKGAVAATLDDVTLTATGKLIVKGAVTATLDDVSLVATAKLILKGSVAATLDDVTLSAAAKLIIKGAVNVTLDDITSFATASHGGNTGTANATLDDISLSATGKLALKGAVNATLDAVTLTATGKTKVQGQVNATLDDVSLVATGKTIVKGNVSLTLDDITAVITGRVSQPLAYSETPIYYIFVPSSRAWTFAPEGRFQFTPSPRNWSYTPGAN